MYEISSSKIDVPKEMFGKKLTTINMFVTVTDPYLQIENKLNEWADDNELNIVFHLLAFGQRMSWEKDFLNHNTPEIRCIY